jgi:hypothetical protein
MSPLKPRLIKTSSLGPYSALSATTEKIYTTLDVFPEQGDRTAIAEPTEGPLGRDFSNRSCDAANSIRTIPNIVTYFMIADNKYREIR